MEIPTLLSLTDGCSSRARVVAGNSRTAPSRSRLLLNARGSWGGPAILSALMAWDRFRCVELRALRVTPAPVARPAGDPRRPSGTIDSADCAIFNPNRSRVRDRNCRVLQVIRAVANHEQRNHVDAGGTRETPVSRWHAARPPALPRLEPETCLVAQRPKPLLIPCANCNKIPAVRRWYPPPEDLDGTLRWRARRWRRSLKTARRATITMPACCATVSSTWITQSTWPPSRGRGRSIGTARSRY